ncbi:hypothetical protein K438DRAFT_1841150 [Mycena galopus ATCC 62051]|nr:hypothetical protein K438DRAFT_1841150 [Mycena galopus ATCC 62051]
MSDSTTTIVDGPAPFSGVVDAYELELPPDVILRSGDGVDFHVHKVILKFGAPHCFEGLLTIPTSGNIVRDGKPVIPATEPKEILQALLSLAYPPKTVESFILTAETLGRFSDVYDAARKYQFTHIQRLLETMLEHPMVLDVYPHRAFVISRICRIESIARRAAFSLDALPSIPTGFPEITWDQGQKLLKFAEVCRHSARTILEGQKHSHRYYIENEDDPRQPLMKRPNETSVFVWWDTGAPSHNEACAPGCTGKNLKSLRKGSAHFGGWRHQQHGFRVTSHISRAKCPESI